MGIVPAPEALLTVPIIPSANPLPPPLVSMERTPITTLPAPIHSLSSTLRSSTSTQDTLSIATQSIPTPAENHPTAMQGGSFMGDALCPLPEPLRKRILNLEFVDMADLQPEAWLFEDTTDKSITSIFKNTRSQ